MSVKDAINSLCQVLDSIGVGVLDAETIRQAKFNGSGTVVGSPDEFLSYE